MTERHSDHFAQDKVQFRKGFKIHEYYKRIIKVIKVPGHDCSFNIILLPNVSYKAFSLTTNPTSQSLNINCEVKFCLTAEIGTANCAFSADACPTGYSFTPDSRR